MIVIHSKNRRARPTDDAVASALSEVSSDALRSYVDLLSFPRHYILERRANLRARDLLLELLRRFGYEPRLQGNYDNVVVRSGGPEDGPFLLLGAHYDSVPDTPGADDNGSAVAVCLECARLIKQHGIGSTMIVFFNREEDGLLGSTEFVHHLGTSVIKVEEAHVFEMVGYCTHAPGSQRMPPGLPGFLAPDVGDFLGLLAARGSNRIAEQLVRLAASYVTDSPVIALKMFLGVEKYFAHLHRSDHAPFWKAKIPAIMWTDTSEFRNLHYHGTTDTPDTLDYGFMSNVAKLALARAMTRD